MTNFVTRLITEAKENYQQKVNQYSKYGYSLSEQDFQNLCKMDPTSNGMLAGKYFDWLYKQGFASLSDTGASSVRYNLEMFDRNTVALQRAGQSVNINDYKDADELMKALSVIDTWQNLVKKYGNQIQKIYSDDKFVVIRCITWEAERAFGKYSHWCTAVLDHDTFFRAYNSQNMLFICIPIENGTPNIKSDYIMQCDVSTGPNGQGTPKFHCADKADKVFYSFKSYFNQYPQYADNELCQFLHDNYDPKFKSLDDDEEVDMSDFDDFQRFIYERLGIVTHDVDYVDSVYCECDGYESEDESNLIIFIREAALSDYLCDYYSENEADYYFTERADWYDIENYIESCWWKDWVSEYARCCVEETDFECDEDGHTIEEVVESLMSDFSEGYTETIQLIQPYLDDSFADMDEDSQEEALQEACESYAEQNIRFDRNEHGQTEDEMLESIEEDTDVSVLQEYYSSANDFFSRHSNAIDTGQWANDIVENIDTSDMLDMATDGSYDDCDIVEINGLIYIMLERTF